MIRQRHLLRKHFPVTAISSQEQTYTGYTGAVAAVAFPVSSDQSLLQGINGELNANKKNVAKRVENNNSDDNNDNNSGNFYSAVSHRQGVSTPCFTKPVKPTNIHVSLAYI